MGGHKPAALISDGVKEGGRNQACARFVGIELAKGQTAQQAYDAAMIWNQKNQPPLEEEEVRSVVNSIARAEAEKPKPPPVVMIDDQPLLKPALPDGYRILPSGAMAFEGEDADGNPKLHLFTVFPCQLMAVCRKEYADEESYVFLASHPHNGDHTFLITREAYDNSGWLGEMGKNCTDISNPKLFKQYVKDASAI